MNTQEFKTLVKKDGYKQFDGWSYYNTKNNIYVIINNNSIFLLKEGDILIKYKFNNYIDIIYHINNILYQYNLCDILPSLNYYIRNKKLEELLATT